MIRAHYYQLNNWASRKQSSNLLLDLLALVLFLVPRYKMFRDVKASVSV